MYNTHDGPVEGARAAGGKCGWTKAQPLPAGRTGNGVPVSQFGMFARVARGGGGEIPPMYDLEFSFIKLHKKSQSSFTKLHKKDESSFIKLHFTERNALTINVRDEIISERE